MVDIQNLREDLVTANQILANEGVLDALGHVSVRHPENDSMLVSAYQSPALVESDDLLEMTFEGEVLDDQDTYSETVIHRAIYRARDDVNAVVHHHAPSIIPFTSSSVEFRSVTHVGALFYDETPTFRDYSNERGRMVVGEEEGDRMAATLGGGRAMFLANHGANVVGRSIREAVVVTMHFVNNAQHQLWTELLGSPEYLHDGEEAKRTVEEVILRPRTVDRVWNYLENRL